jgi:hypothetical protein
MGTKRSSAEAGPSKPRRRLARLNGQCLKFKAQSDPLLTFELEPLTSIAENLA